MQQIPLYFQGKSDLLKHNYPHTKSQSSAHQERTTWLFQTMLGDLALQGNRSSAILQRQTAEHLSYPLRASSTSRSLVTHEEIKVPKLEQIQSCSGKSLFRDEIIAIDVGKNRFATYLNRAVEYWIISEFKQTSSNCPIFKQVTSGLL